MRASRMRLNPTKTQVMWLGSSQQLKHVDINDIPLLSTTIQVVESARDLGIILDRRLTLSAHLAALCRSGYYQLRQLTSPGRKVDDGGSCKNHSCGVYFLPVRLLQFAALRSARHSIAQASVCAECHCTTDHWHATQWSYLVGITWLHRLPIRERVSKWCLVPLSLSGQAPLYLADDCRLVPDSTRCSLLSADVSTCVVPQTLSSHGDRTFAAAAGPCLWNSLPVQLRNPDIIYGLFRRQLKGHLFGSMNTALCDFWYAAPYLLTYL